LLDFEGYLGFLCTKNANLKTQKKHSVRHFPCHVVFCIVNGVTLELANHDKKYEIKFDLYYELYIK